MDSQVADKHILDWNESDVHKWLSSLGYAQYERQIREHKIRGDSLCVLDSEGLKSIGIATIGQRLSILKAVYLIKLTQNVPIYEDDYVPPSEAPERVDNISIEKLHSIVKDQAQRLRVLEDENRTLSNAMRSFYSELLRLRSSLGITDEPMTQSRKQLQGIESGSSSSSTVNEIEQGRITQTPDSGSGSSVYPTPQSTKRPEDSETINPAKISLDDPTWKVLPAALKKHNIKNDDWQNYAMFISYGPPGNRVKRRLDHDEKPLYLFKKLKDAKKNPAFVLKNMKDLSSPVVKEDKREPVSVATEVPKTGAGSDQGNLTANSLQPTLPLAIPRRSRPQTLT
ncbi:hypothetical protein B0H34DRAFT_411179 [Crassisporium funariophilum]|nr:hypothetical protein B0H34DRAFT_411179 [Crassisporium funariophilum]